MTTHRDQVADHPFGEITASAPQHALDRPARRRRHVDRGDPYLRDVYEQTRDYAADHGVHGTRFDAHDESRPEDFDPAPR